MVEKKILSRPINHDTMEYYIDLPEIDELFHEIDLLKEEIKNLKMGAHSHIQPIK